MSFQAGTQISFTISIDEVMRPGLTVLSATYQIWDETDTALNSATPVFAIHSNGVTNTVDVNVGANFNEIEPSSHSEGRSVVVTVTLSDNSKGTVMFDYVIENIGTGLVQYLNTAVTMTAAARIAAEMNIESWSNYSTAKKLISLKTAWKNLMKLRYVRYNSAYADSAWSYQMLAGGNIFPEIDLELMQPPQIAALDATFLSVLAQAQVAEANSYLINLDKKVRDSGLIEDTIGETTQKYSASNPVRPIAGVSPEALTILRRYISAPSSVKIARA